EHSGRPSAEAGGSRNRHQRSGPIGRAKADLFVDRERNRPGAGADGNGSLGSGARKYWQSSPRPANASGQGEVSNWRAGKLGQTAFGLMPDSAWSSRTCRMPSLWLLFRKGEAGFFRNPDVHSLLVTPGNRR